MKIFSSIASCFCVKSVCLQNGPKYAWAVDALLFRTIAECPGDRGAANVAATFLFLPALQNYMYPME